MHADARKLLWDARQATDRVARLTRGKTFDDDQAHELPRSGVERQLAIVGEALGQLRRIDPAASASIARLSRVVVFRNVLVHACANVDSRIVRGIVKADVAPLRSSLGALPVPP